jgi:hypothetical protein
MRLEAMQPREAERELKAVRQRFFKGVTLMKLVVFYDKAADDSCFLFCPQRVVNSWPQSLQALANRAHTSCCVTPEAGSSINVVP